MVQSRLSLTTNIIEILRRKREFYLFIFRPLFNLLPEIHQVNYVIHYFTASFFLQLDFSHFYLYGVLYCNLFTGWSPSSWMVRYFGLSCLACAAGYLPIHLHPNHATTTGLFDWKLQFLIFWDAWNRNRCGIFPVEAATILSFYWLHIIQVLLSFHFWLWILTYFELLIISILL